MKRFTVFIIIAIMVLTSISSAVCLEDTSTGIVEKPDLKIVVEGKQLDLIQVPIQINDSLMLPAMPLLTSFGVKNNKTDMIWNAEEQSLTFVLSSKTYILKADCAELNINGSVKIIEEAPIVYNGVLYVSLSSIADNFGKIIEKDDLSKRIYVRDGAAFKKVQAIMLKIKNSQGAYKKTRFKLSSQYTNLSGEIDRQNKKIRFKSLNDMMGQILEYYILDNTVYFHGPNLMEEGDSWGYFKLGGNVLAESYNIPLNYSNSLCAGLILTEDKKKGKIILEGDTYIDEFYKRPTIYYDMAVHSEIKKAHTRMEFDSKTFFMNYGSMDLSYRYLDEQGVDKDKITYTYSDYNNKSINITVSDKNIKQAQNYESTLIGSGFERFEDSVVP